MRSWAVGCVLMPDEARISGIGCLCSRNRSRPGSGSRSGRQVPSDWQDLRLASGGSSWTQRDCSGRLRRCAPDDSALTGRPCAGGTSHGWSLRQRRRMALRCPGRNTLMAKCLAGLRRSDGKSGADRAGTEPRRQRSGNAGSDVPDRAGGSPPGPLSLWGLASFSFRGSGMAPLVPAGGGGLFSSYSPFSLIFPSAAAACLPLPGAWFMVAGSDRLLIFFLWISFPFSLFLFRILSGSWVDPAQDWSLCILATHTIMPMVTPGISTSLQ